MSYGLAKFVGQFGFVQRSRLFNDFGLEQGPNCLYIADPHQARQAGKLSYASRKAIRHRWGIGCSHVTGRRSWQRACPLVHDFFAKRQHGLD